MPLDAYILLQWFPIVKPGLCQNLGLYEDFVD